MIWSSKSVLPSQNFDAHRFHVLKKNDFRILLPFYDIYDFGPKAPGAHGTLRFLTFVGNLIYGLGPI